MLPPEEFPRSRLILGICKMKVRPPLKPDACAASLALAWRSAPESSQIRAEEKFVPSCCPLMEAAF